MNCAKPKGQRRRRRKLRRGGRRSSKNQGKLVVLHSNIRGFNSKKESLFQVLKDVDPDICILNETGLRGRNKVNIPGYLTYTKNRVKKYMGGISTSIKDKLRNFTVNVGQGIEEDEYLITRLDNFNPAVCVINCYGEQEGRAGKDEVEARWARLKQEMDRIKARGEGCLLVGDLNKWVGNDEFGVAGNHGKITNGGRLVRELIPSEEYSLVNNMEVAVGGPFTRVDPVDGRDKSCIDLVICSVNLRPFIDRLFIDSGRRYAMKRVIFKDGNFRTIFSDHFTIILTLKNLPSAMIRREKMIRWNLQKEGGWDKYKELAEDRSKDMTKIIEDEGMTIDEVVKGFEKVNDDIKFNAFGKITLKDKHKDVKKGKDVTEHVNVNEEVEAKEILKRQTDKAEKELMKLKESNQGRTGSVFKIAQAVQGPKKGGSMEAHAIVDPHTGEVAVSAKEIKRVSLEYCREVLTKNVAGKEFEEEIKLKEILHRERMEDGVGGGFVPSMETYKKVVKKFDKSKKRNYDFLIKTGDKFKQAVFMLCKRMLMDEEFPVVFDNTTLFQIYKGKGKREILANNRYIHSKDWLPRLAEGMAVEEMRNVILDGSSPYQIGGQPGHQPQEHIFTVKSILAKYEAEGELVMLQAYDISKFFDKEALPDVMNTLHELGVDRKAYRTWYHLNKNTNIRVKTGVGYTEWSNEGPMIGQGTGGGALVSQANLDRGMVDMFQGSEDEVRYGGVRMLPLMFQDDIMRAVDSISAARAGNVKVDSVMKSKQLCLNPDKTGYIMFGHKREVAAAREEVVVSPIVCGNFITKEKVADKWLGDMFHQEGLAASVIATIDDREPKVKAAFYEAAAIVEDWRCQVVGGYLSALDLFELAILPTLLYNAETWMDISKAAVERLENLQLFYLRLTLRVPQSTPKIALRAETGMLSMKLRIWKKKLMFVHHVKNLSDTALAKQVWKEQIRNGWPGLAKEATKLCSELGIEDVNKTKCSKGEWKKVVRTACKNKDMAEMLEGLKGKTKYEELKMGDCEIKTYMGNKSLKQVRDIFRVRTHMVEGFKANFKNMYKGQDTNCDACRQASDSQCHALVCKAYDDLREGMDINKDADLVTFFKKVMERRLL